MILGHAVAVVIHVGIGGAYQVLAVAILINAISADLVGIRIYRRIIVGAVALFFGESVFIRVVVIIEIVQGDSQVKLGEGNGNQPSFARQCQSGECGHRFDDRTVCFERNHGHGKVDGKGRGRLANRLDDRDAVFGICIVVQRQQESGDVGHSIIGFVFCPFHKIHRCDHRCGFGGADDNAPDEKLDRLALHIMETAPGIGDARSGVGPVFQAFHHAVYEYAFFYHRP